MHSDQHWASDKKQAHSLIMVSARRVGLRAVRDGCVLQVCLGICNMSAREGRPVGSHVTKCKEFTNCNMHTLPYPQFSLREHAKVACSCCQVAENVMQGHHDEELTWDSTHVFRICLPFCMNQQLYAKLKNGPRATNVLERLHEYVDEPEVLMQGSAVQEQTIPGFDKTHTAPGAGHGVATSLQLRQARPGDVEY